MHRRGLSKTKSELVLRQGIEKRNSPKDIHSWDRLARVAFGGPQLDDDPDSSVQPEVESIQWGVEGSMHEEEKVVVVWELQDMGIAHKLAQDAAAVVERAAAEDTSRAGCMSHWEDCTVMHEEW